MRAYNPCTAPRSLRVLANGWLDGVADAGFQLEWKEILEPTALSVSLVPAGNAPLL